MLISMIDLHNHIHQGAFVVCLSVRILAKSSKHFGLSFAYDAPKIWNDLPDDVHSATSLYSLRRKLKTFPFAQAYPP